MQEQTMLKARLFSLLAQKGAMPRETLLKELDTEPAQADAMLEDLCRTGQLVQTKKGNFTHPSTLGMVTGRVQGHAKGFGFLIRENGEPDLYIPSDAMQGAMNGDTVLARPTRGDREAEVVSILTRANDILVGRFDRDGQDNYVVPDDKRIAFDIRVPAGSEMNADNGAKVVVRITKYASNGRAPVGRVIEILGMSGDIKADMLGIIRLHELREDFPQNVLNDAAKLPDEVTEQDIQGRSDFRALNTFTIDGADARDFDDALSLEPCEAGFRLGVHIADVSHYVRRGTLLDTEANKRATSVYLPGMVLPMLPEKLSNGLCSLNPGVDRLTMSCVMDVDENGQVVRYTIDRAVIRSHARLVYENVTAALENNDPAGLEGQFDDLKKLRELYEILNRKRLRRGALDLDVSEMHITLDENGIPVDIGKEERGVANRMVEEFMLLANETVAAHAKALELPFLYRVHETPDDEKLKTFDAFLHNLGYHIKKGKEGTKVQPKALQNVLNDCADKPEAKVISSLMLRSLQKARYAPSPLGHFGLAAKDYCHFTSPIRRYPDLFIHRVLKAQLTAHPTTVYGKGIDELAAHCSAMERSAMEAERDADDLLACLYMKDHIGMEAEGIISGVMGFGLFVTLPNTVEGMIHVSHLDDDYYVYDEATYSLIGERRRKVYRLGDSIFVRVDAVNLETHRIELTMATPPEQQA